jgi:hypothetical protein
MSRWVSGIYNRAANFNLSNALRAASMGGLGRNSKQLHTSANQRDKYVESCKPCESNKPSKHGSTCHRHRDTPCGSGNHCYANNCGHTDSASDNLIEREYNEYIAATRSAERQDTSARIWSGDELGDSKRSNSTARTNIEHITGIPTGVTV